MTTVLAGSRVFHMELVAGCTMSGLVAVFSYWPGTMIYHTPANSKRGFPRYADSIGASQHSQAHQEIVIRGKFEC